MHFGRYMNDLHDDIQCIPGLKHLNRVEYAYQAALKLETMLESNPDCAIPFVSYASSATVWAY